MCSCEDLSLTERVTMSETVGTATYTYSDSHSDSMQIGTMSDSDSQGSEWVIGRVRWCVSEVSMLVND